MARLPHYVHVLVRGAVSPRIQTLFPPVKDLDREPSYMAPEYNKHNASRPAGYPDHDYYGPGR
jgi:hypothetical protein